MSSDTENVISFPGTRWLNPLTEEHVKVWRTGLSSTDHEEQWRTFQGMSNFSDVYVLQIIQDFLLSDSGEALLKTKFLQVLKNSCPSSLTLSVRKGKETGQIVLADVPLGLTEWQEEFRQPLHMLEERAYADPTMVTLATELWLYFLEKEYPFNTLLTDNTLTTESTCLSAGLHIYTLSLIKEEEVQEQLEQVLQKQYALTPEELKQCYQHFKRSLQGF